MSERAVQPGFAFDAVAFDAADAAQEAGEALIVDLGGFEGPLHLLLALARNQKVDLTQLSITDLADQYLAYVQAARRRRFALAADYLVMAAWLIYLKSKLLLPKPQARTDPDDPEPNMAEALALRLVKLEAVRRAASALAALPQTGRDVFTRGDPQARTVHGALKLEGDLFQLVMAYAAQRQRRSGRSYSAQARVEAFALEDARARLRALLPRLAAWTPLDQVTPHASAHEGPSRASYLASTFAAGLEMVRDGSLDVQQLDVFARLFVKAKAVGLELQERPVDETVGVAA